MTTPTPERAAQPQSKGEHTAGPWRVNADNQQIGDVWSIPADVPVAQAQMIGSLLHPNHEERRANARLIAAAPELLAACQAYAKADRDGGVSMADLGNIARNKILAAIRKAEQVQQ